MLILRPEKDSDPNERANAHHILI